jgi:molecular chaperone HscB
MKKENAVVENPSMSKITTDTYGANPFDVFGLEPSYSIDLKALDRAYFDLQKIHHPDKKTIEDDGSINASLINAAYQTLKSPVGRAEALLHLIGMDIPGQNGETVGAEVMLLDILDFQETIMMCEDHEEATYVKEELEEHFSEDQHAFSENFDKGHFDELPAIYVKLSYIDRLRKQVAEVEHTLFKRTARMH